MKRLIGGIFAVALFILAIIFVLSSDTSLVTHPKGPIARSESHLISIVYILAAIIVIPTFIALLHTVWKYRSNRQAKYEPEKEHGILGELLPWIFPIVIIGILAPITWHMTHKLDPYKPIQSNAKPLTIQVMALDWKWLFIYPELGIATVNLMQFPAKVPINLRLTADGSPMNSFWIPQLSGQIYSMAGMITQLHIMADEPGVYSGRAAEINGKGYANMTFVAKSSSQSDFDDWVATVKQSPLTLTGNLYDELAKPSIKHPVTLYSSVDSDLFNQKVMKYMHP